MNLGHPLVDPALEPCNLLLANLASLVQAAEIAVGRSDVCLELLDRRRQFALAALALHLIDQLVNLCRAKDARVCRVVQGETLDAEQTVIQQPLAEEALRSQKRCQSQDKMRVEKRDSPSHAE